MVMRNARSLVKRSFKHGCTSFTDVGGSTDFRKLLCCLNVKANADTYFRKPR
jgi:hypothetical protein